MLVTVWLALKLVIEGRMCDEIEVEPASQEDIEAKLDVPGDSASGSVGFATKQIELDVQIKSRESGQWTESSFREVLDPPAPKPAKDSKPQLQRAAAARRIRPLARLREAPARRYLLITNAQLDSNLREFSITTVGADSAARGLPMAKQPADAATIAPRIGVLAQQTKEYLELQIGDLLGRCGHVQPSRVHDCLVDLQGAVRHRLLGDVGGAWRREELEAILRKHGGLPPPLRELVPPQNFPEIRARLEAGRLILTGPPGTGKTFVAEHLEHEHRTSEKRFEIVTAVDGIAHIRRCLAESGSHLFVFPDPWGHYRLEPDADFWRGELPKLFLQASPEKRFLVTSRTAVKAQAMGDGTPAGFEEAEVEITPADYPIESRKRILALQMRAAVPWQRELVEREEDCIVRELGAPFSLEQFADALKREKNESAVKIDDLIRRSNMEVISRATAEEVKALGVESIAAGVALWALFMTHDTVSEAMASTLRQQLEDGGYRDAIDPLQLLRGLRKAGRLVAHPNGFSVHPTVMQGLEMLIDEEPARAEKVLSAQLRSLAAHGTGPELETLAKYIATRNLPIPPAAQSALNEHLRQQVLTLDGSAWQQAFRLLARFSTGTDGASLLVKGLRPGERTEMRGFEHWQPPTLGSDEIALIRAAPETRGIAVKFVQHILANDQVFDCKASELTEFFAQFGWDLSDEFFDIVVEALDDMRTVPMEICVEAALLTTRPRFDELIDKALAASDALDVWYAGYKEQIRQAEQCEVDAAHASHVDEQPADRFWPVQTALYKIVAVRRGLEGYEWLLKHPRRKDLVSAWAASLSKGATDAELAALRRTCEPGDERPFWKAVETSDRPDMASAVADGLETAPDDQLGDCLETLAKLLPAPDWQSLLEQRARRLPLPRRLALIVANFRGDAAGEKRQLLRAALFDPGELHAIELCLDERETSEAVPVPTEVSKKERDFLEEIVHHGPDRLAVEALRVLGIPAQLGAEYLPHLLASPSLHTRHNALLLAAEAKGFDRRAILFNALRDQDYRCRRVAMRLLAENADAEVKERILAMADDASAPVREACANVIAQHRWSEGASVLVRLLLDPRDSSVGSGYQFNLPNCHVARAAARALKDLSPLSAETIGAIINCVEDFRPSQKRREKADIGVPYQCLLTLAKERHEEIPSLYLRRLGDSWRVEGMEQSGYPLRFAAAWGLVIQLSDNPRLLTQIDPAAIAEGAGHSDDRLAGPCLIALGLLGNRGYAQLVTLASSPHFTPDRALIVATALPKAATAARDVVAGLPPDSPQQRFLAWAEQHAAASAQDAELFLTENPDVAAWVDRIQAKEGIFPALRCALHIRFEKLFGTKFQYDDLFSRHLPKSIPILTMRSMFGGE